jgi:hypothetical protein
MPRSILIRHLYATGVILGLVLFVGAVQAAPGPVTPPNVGVTAQVIVGGGGGGPPGTKGAPAPDMTAPVVVSVQVRDISPTGATLTWSTDEAATSGVIYGVSTSYGTQASDATLVAAHAVTLAGLSSGTLYHFYVSSTDLAGNTASSEDFSFMTAGPPDATPPVITDIRVEIITATTARVTWNTDEPATDVVDYGLTPGYGLGSVVNAVLRTSHDALFTSLRGDTRYHFRILATDAAGNYALSADQTFATYDDRSPLLIDVRVENVTMDSADIVWNTDEPSRGQVDYGITASYSGGALAESEFATAHRVTAYGLSPLTLYHFRISAADVMGNEAVSGDETFVTASDSVPPSNTRSFTAVAGDSRASLAWVNPADRDFVGVLVRRSTAAYPGSPTAGVEAYRGAGASFVDSGLTNGVTYYYTGFAFDDAGNFASGAIASATPISVSIPLPPTAPACAACSHLSYDVFIVNPDGTERHRGTRYAQVSDLGGGSFRVGFEDKGNDFDYNDALVDVRAADCAAVALTLVGTDAAWHHQVWFRVFVDGAERAKVLVAADDTEVAGTTKTIDARGIAGVACLEVPPLPQEPIVTPPIVTPPPPPQPMPLSFTDETVPAALEQGTLETFPQDEVEVMLPASSVVGSVQLLTLTVNGDRYLMTPDGTGRYLTKFEAPGTIGDYPARIAILFADGSSLETPWILRVLPLGFVYEATGAGHERVAGATVTLYESDGTQWNGARWRQRNPQATGPDGTYRFLVLPGTYELRVNKDGYYPASSGQLTVASPVNLGIELIRRPAGPIIGVTDAGGRMFQAARYGASVASVGYLRFVRDPRTARTADLTAQFALWLILLAMLLELAATDHFSKRALIGHRRISAQHWALAALIGDVSLIAGVVGFALHPTGRNAATLIAITLLYLYYRHRHRLLAAFR